MNVIPKSIVVQNLTVVSIILDFLIILKIADLPERDSVAEDFVFLASELE
ncbi:hypothetical protein ACQKM9_20780 [Viridibacillus sp. NPDC093762]